jgi:hypothetical protein
MGLTGLIVFIPLGCFLRCHAISNPPSSDKRTAIDSILVSFLTGVNPGRCTRHHPPDRSVTATEAGLRYMAVNQAASYASCKPSDHPRSKPAPVVYNSGTFRAGCFRPPDRMEVSRRLLGTIRVRLGSPCWYSATGMGAASTTLGGALWTQSGAR